MKFYFLKQRELRLRTCEYQPKTKTKGKQMRKINEAKREREIKIGERKIS